MTGAQGTEKPPQKGRIGGPKKKRPAMGYGGRTMTIGDNLSGRGGTRKKRGKPERKVDRPSKLRPGIKTAERSEVPR